MMAYLRGYTLAHLDMKALACNKSEDIYVIVPYQKIDRLHRMFFPVFFQRTIFTWVFFGSIGSFTMRGRNDERKCET